MSTTESPLAGATCEKCGMAVHMDDEGQIACDGCGQTTDKCSCQSTS